ncbi:hypothetical protein [Leptolyngbya ohadii]|uniref:hypothetical protein n=1 Tax=Leptolyngbya ohadii TaxID=1962290 RepID=UPI000B59A701|nr:hypothetical protein [Leptolyngbya ohadii]
MNQTDLIILTVYLISITYVIYQAINSLEAQTIIKFEKGALTQVLSEALPRRSPNPSRNALRH